MVGGPRTSSDMAASTNRNSEGNRPSCPIFRLIVVELMGGRGDTTDRRKLISALYQTAMGTSSIVGNLNRNFPLKKWSV